MGLDFVRLCSVQRQGYGPFTFKIEIVDILVPLNLLLLIRVFLFVTPGLLFLALASCCLLGRCCYLS